MNRCTGASESADRSTTDAHGHGWALVLAGGEGRRLSALTRDAAGRVVPKQYCSLDGGATLLEQAIRRGRMASARSRTCVVVTEAHRPWWQPALSLMPSGNIYVQPGNKGTAIGILLPLVRLLERDLDARVILLPADHYVHDEVALDRAIRAADEAACRHPDNPILLGMIPEMPDPELGYIVPAEASFLDWRDDDTRGVLRFVEKPGREEAASLLWHGALWSTFILAAQARTLYAMYLRRMPEVVLGLHSALASDHGVEGGPALRGLYERLPALDFSRDLIAPEATQLRVHRSPACGWTDLGTPARLVATLKRRSGTRPVVSGSVQPPAGAGRPALSLASQLQRLSAGAGAALPGTALTGTA